MTFASFARRVAEASGRPLTFSVAIGAVGAWAVCGPLFGYSDGWQLVINTSTTICTFLMVFLIQHVQNRDSKSIQVKLDELLHSTNAARNELIGVERRPDVDLDQLRPPAGEAE